MPAAASWSGAQSIAWGRESQELDDSTTTHRHRRMDVVWPRGPGDLGVGQNYEAQYDHGLMDMYYQPMV